ncbi:MAG: hypothetical protein ACKOPQ_06890 [Novosphingobium sp.]
MIDQAGSLLLSIGSATLQPSREGALGTADQSVESGGFASLLASKLTAQDAPAPMAPTLLSPPQAAIGIDSLAATPIEASLAATPALPEPGNILPPTLPVTLPAAVAAGRGVDQSSPSMLTDDAAKASSPPASAPTNARTPLAPAKASVARAGRHTVPMAEPEADLETGAAPLLAPELPGEPAFAQADGTATLPGSMAASDTPETPALRPEHQAVAPRSAEAEPMQSLPQAETSAAPLSREFAASPKRIQPRPAARVSEDASPRPDAVHAPAKRTAPRAEADADVQRVAQEKAPAPRTREMPVAKAQAIPANAVAPAAPAAPTAAIETPPQVQPLLASAQVGERQKARSVANTAPALPAQPKADRPVADRLPTPRGAKQIAESAVETPRVSPTIRVAVEGKALVPATTTVPAAPTAIVLSALVPATKAPASAPASVLSTHIEIEPSTMTAAPDVSGSRPFAGTEHTGEQRTAAATLPPMDLPATSIPAPVMTTTESVPAMPVTARTEAPIDFAQLVDRLVAAREAATPGEVRVSLNHSDFGKVSLAFAPDASGLNVTLTSPNPEFARAVEAASPAVAMPATTDSANTSNLQSRSGDSSATSGHGQAQTQGQNQNQSGARQPSGETRAASPRANPSNSGETPGSQSERRRGIFA